MPELRWLGDLLEQLRLLDERIGGYDREIEAQARLSEPAQRLVKIRGIGATTALAIVTTVGNAREFKNGRQFAAWIGLVPGQCSTGGKARLGHISKRGDAYLLNLLVQGARSVLKSARAPGSPLALGARASRARRLLPNSGGDRQQERAHRLGAARQGRHPWHELISPPDCNRR